MKLNQTIYKIIIEKHLKKDKKTKCGKKINTVDTL